MHVESLSINRHQFAERGASGQLEFRCCHQIGVSFDNDLLCPVSFGQFEVFSKPTSKETLAGDKDGAAFIDALGFG